MVELATILTGILFESIVRVSKRRVVSRRGEGGVGGEKGEKIGRSGGMGKRAVNHLLLLEKRLLLERGSLPNATVG